MTKEFGIMGRIEAVAGVAAKPGFNLLHGQMRAADEAGRLTQMRLAATPPAGMEAAPMAPARGTMQLVQDWDILPGGTRRAAGSHWVEPTRLDVMNAHAMDQARAKDPDVSRAKAEEFTPAQVAMARRYRDLVEWRAGSAIKCASLEGSNGGGSGAYIDSFITAGKELAALRAAIGNDVVLSPRRHMDRGNSRCPLTVRQAIDAVVLKGWTVSKVVAKAGWAAKGTTRRQVRDAIRGALDRMQGYR